MTIDEASDALTQVRTTLLVLGTNGPAGAHFMVGNWGTQASFDPWRFVMLLKKSARTLQYAKANGAFTVNLLDAPRQGLVREIQKAKGEGRAGEPGTLGAPRLPEAYAGWDCKLLQTVDIGGDHELVVADIVDGWRREGGPSLGVQDLKLSYAG